MKLKGDEHDTIQIGRLFSSIGWRNTLGMGSAQHVCGTNLYKAGSDDLTGIIPDVVGEAD